MSPTGRVLLGAAFGAIVTLIAHPISRPYILAVFDRPNSEIQAILKPEAGRLPPPTSLVDAGRWLRSGAEKLVSHVKLLPREISSETMIAQEARRHDPTNAYWSQMLAVLDHERGNDRAARAEWMAGANCTVWNDYQTDLLLQRRSKLVGSIKQNQSWQFAYFYQQRSRAAAHLIERLARNFLAKADYASPSSLEIRYATVMNGARLKEGSRNLGVGQIGADIVELAAYPAPLASRPNPKRLLLGQNELFNHLVEYGKPDLARKVQVDFKANEAWHALTNVSRPDDEESNVDRASDAARDLGIASIFEAVLPGTLLVVSIAGFAIWIAGVWLDRFVAGRRSFGKVLPAVTALTLGGAVMALTSFAPAALASALCGGFIAASPVKQRQARPTEFGPLFYLVIGCLAVLFGFGLAMFLLGCSEPACALLPFLSVPPDYFGGSPLFIGLSVLFFSLLFLVTPFWAMAQRLGTPLVFSQGLQRFGAMLAGACLFGAVIGGPIAVYADQRTADTLFRLLGNEPLYYIQQNENRS